MKSMIAFTALAAVAAANTPAFEAFEDMRALKLAKAEQLTGAQLIDYVNGAQTFWKAKENKRFSGMTFEQKKAHIAGVRGGVEHIAVQAAGNVVSHENVNLKIDNKFDSRENWPNCPSIKKIRDQSSCGSCWAFGAAEAISDRICIASEGKQIVDISAADLMSCCGFSCGSGCNGGFPLSAWRFYVSDGLVSGSTFAEHKGCFPYPFEECEHHSNKTHYQPCPGPLYPTPKCTKQCQNGYPTSYKADKHYGKSAYSVRSKEEDIQKEIMQFGPVEASFSVYDDFEHYESGVYVHTGGKYLGGHAVKIIGWGVDEESKLPYWHVANSWNEDWGEMGYFRILRGKNEVGIEGGIVAGLPKL